MRQQKNRKMIIAAIGIPLTLFSLWVLIGYLPTRSIDMPSYTVIERKPDYEIRQYESFIVAETNRQGPPSESMASGFNELFKYISGENVSQSKIKMTAPVIRYSEGKGQKIPMTAPVLKQGLEGAGTIAFVMPPGSRLEELPQPKSPSVILRVVPAHKVAVITFSGYATDDTIKEKTANLVQALQRDAIPVISVPRVALYNPPWTPPFLRRNEVMIEVD
ncbi:MAG: heme-binding protein [Deltaproteobacteria bacterium]|nr:heme-binding protein [Deltaproteobacteria bacterium]TLN00303.1 MAG: heme-binding protein [bacterium]